jgi:hypothetical protein
LGHRISLVKSTISDCYAVFVLNWVDLREIPTNCLRRTIGVLDKNESGFSFVGRIFLYDGYLIKYMPIICESEVYCQ